MWKIGGEAGQGIMTTGLLLAKMVTRLGYEIFDYAEYPSLVRGGLNTYEVAISKTSIFSTLKNIDLLVCLNKQTYELNKKRLTKKTVIVFDPEEFEPNTSKSNLVAIPLQTLLTKNDASVVMVNMLVLGASVALLGIDSEVGLKLIKEQFENKSEEIVNTNQRLLMEGYNYIKINFPKLCLPLPEQKAVDEKYVMTANDAFSVAAVAADCRFYVAYPMTPASSVLSTLAAWQKETDIVVRHPEDEIAVINNALGAAFVGVRSAVGTSGGGFALMTEAISLAGVIELPLVVFLSQRPGPATGMPTWTEQGDLLFAVNSGHGEFPKIVLAPGDVRETLELGLKAFDLADIYQVPVILLTDKLLSESHLSLSQKNTLNFLRGYKINRGKTVTKSREEKYLRYKIVKDGISPRLISNESTAYYQANSYEHSEDGHTSELSKDRIEQVNKRNRKIQTYLKSDFKGPVIYGDIEKASYVFVTWGSMKGAALEAVGMIKEEVALIHFSYLFPLDKKKLVDLFSKNKKYILIENNATAQFKRLLLSETGIEISNVWLKYNGRPWWPEEIVTEFSNFKKHDK
jgi:2-oxoglutarate ferredoxin oxidoreductase subunit alpha